MYHFHIILKALLVISLFMQSIIYIFSKETNRDPLVYFLLGLIILQQPN